MRGFTLIELLAVIVILAIILIIAIPLINGLIEETKKSAFSSSAEMIAKTAENLFLKNQLDGNNTPIKVVFAGGIITEGNIAFSGKKPQSGIILVNKSGKTAYALYDGKFCSEKSYLEANATTTVVDEVDCVLQIPAPVVTLLGNATVEVVMGQAYTEAGVTAVDENGVATTNIATEITKNGGIVASVDTSSIGTYIIKYIATGEALTGEITRTVNITDACGYDFTDSRDSQTYTTVRIGTQCFMSKDLNYNGGCLSNSWASGNSCINQPAGFTGKSYQWNTIMNGQTAESSKGICPTGWHIPSDSEWKTMESFLGMSAANLDAQSSRGIQGTYLKSIASGGTNTTGFNGTLMGYSSTGGANTSKDQYGIYWTSTQSGGLAWSRYLITANTSIDRFQNGINHGFAVRCVMD